jgi:hypothetical protein
MRLQLAIATPLVAVLAAGGCGGASSNSNSSSKFSGTEQDVAKVVEAYQKASEKQDGHKICADLITADLQLKITRANRARGKGCAQVVKDGLKDTDQADLTVKTVTLAGGATGATGATASVKQKTADKQSRTTTLTLEKVAGEWRISGLPS